MGMSNDAQQNFILVVFSGLTYRSFSPSCHDEEKVTEMQKNKKLPQPHVVLLVNKYPQKKCCKYLSIVKKSLGICYFFYVQWLFSVDEFCLPVSWEVYIVSDGQYEHVHNVSKYSYTCSLMRCNKPPVYLDSQHLLTVFFLIELFIFVVVLFLLSRMYHPDAFIDFP